MHSKPFSRTNPDVQNVDLWSSPHCPSPGHQREGKGGACSQGGELSGTARVHSDPTGAAADLLPSSHPSWDHVQCKIVFKGQAQKMQSSYLWISWGNILKCIYFTLRFDFMKKEHVFWEALRSRLIWRALTSNFLLIRDVYWNTMLSFLKAMPYFNQSHTGARKWVKKMFFGKQTEHFYCFHLFSVTKAAILMKTPGGAQGGRMPPVRRPSSV